MIANTAPDPRLRFDPRALGLTEPPRAFYRRGTVAVARALVGAWLGAAAPGPLVRRPHRRDGGLPRRGGSGVALLRRPPHRPRRADVRRRRPPLRLPRLRNAPLRQRRHAPRGRRRGRPPARRRGPGRAPPRLMSGPGKLCAALGITTRDSGLDLVGDSAIRIFIGGRRAVASASLRASASTTPATPKTGPCASSTRIAPRSPASPAGLDISSRRE